MATVSFLAIHCDIWYKKHNFLKLNTAVLTEIVPQAELSTRCGFIQTFTYTLVHDPLKMAHMCRNMSGQN